MSQMTTEVELKYRIQDAKHLDVLLGVLPAPEASFTQTNHYLDDAERTLRKADIMLRAREITLPFPTSRSVGKPPVTFTAKKRRSIENGLFISEERAQVMALDDWLEIVAKKLPIPTNGPLFRWLADVVPFGPLEIIGCTINDRYQIRSDLYLLEIDRTAFPDGSVDVEIECETFIPDQARVHIDKLLAGLGIEWGPQTEGKYARFLRKTGA